MSKFTKQTKYSEKVLSKINNSAIIQLQKQKRKNKDTKDKIFEKRIQDRRPEKRRYSPLGP